MSEFKGGYLIALAAIAALALFAVGAYEMNGSSDKDNDTDLDDSNSLTPIEFVISDSLTVKVDGRAVHSYDIVMVSSDTMVEITLLRDGQYYFTYMGSGHIPDILASEGSGNKGDTIEISMTIAPGMIGGQCAIYHAFDVPPGYA